MPHNAFDIDGNRIVNANDPLIPHEHPFFRPVTDFDRQHAASVARQIALNGVPNIQPARLGGASDMMVRPKRQPSSVANRIKEYDRVTRTMQEAV